MILKFTLIGMIFGCTQLVNAEPAVSPESYGIAERTIPQAYLRMPDRADGKVPSLLSQTGAFTDMRNLTPSPGLIPYDLVAAFWSDGAAKSRWISVPSGVIHFSPTGEWKFPKGTVFVKTFELPTNAHHSTRLETRLLVCDSSGGVYGVVYKWRPDQSDADLLSTNTTEILPITTAQGALREQTWYFPSRHDCLVCHNRRAGGVLGVKTRQLNRRMTYPSGIADNELRTWNHIGLFEAGSFKEENLAELPKLASIDDSNRSLEDRARSYLDANCAQCHRPGGTVAYFDARYDTPLDKQGLIDGEVLIDQGIDKPRVIAPRDIWRSIAFMRMNTVGDIQMPPLARETIDEKGVALVREWITSLPGRPVLGPPEISPTGGTYAKPVAVSLSDGEAGTEIRYTLDGSTPSRSDALYTKPLTLAQPTVLRARAYKDGYTKSIAAQQVFIVQQ
jgi:uncharacterized repeat protein (TIGR03806 family)